MLVEFITGDFLFDIFDECDIEYNYVFNIKGFPSASASFTDTEYTLVEYKYLVLLYIILGKPTYEYYEYGNDFYNFRGQPRNDTTTIPRSLTISDCFTLYNIDTPIVLEILPIIEQCLDYNTELRLSAAELLKLNWFNN